MRVVTRHRLALVVLLASLAGLGRLAWPYAEGASFVGAYLPLLVSAGGVEEDEPGACRQG